MANDKKLYKLREISKMYAYPLARLRKDVHQGRLKYIEVGKTKAGYRLTKEDFEAFLDTLKRDVTNKATVS